MNNIPTTGELFATNQVSANTERCYKRQLHNFVEWMADSRDVRDMEAVSIAELLAQLVLLGSLLVILFIIFSSSPWLLEAVSLWMVAIILSSPTPILVDWFSI
jgi:hypothetical protein